MAPTANRRIRTLLMLALVVGTLLTLGATPAQVRVEQTSDTIRGRAPVVVFRPVENRTVAGQAPSVGHALQVEANVSDPDGDAVTDVTFRWRRDGVEIATGDSYVPGIADAGRTLIVEAVAHTDSATTDPSTASATLDIPIAANTAPVATNARITGRPTVGSTVTLEYDYDDADGDQEGATVFNWCRFGVVCGLGSNRTYVITASDAGNTLNGEITPKSLTGTPDTGSKVTVSKFPSTGTITAEAAPTASAVSITGTLRSGQIVTGDYAYADANNDAEGATTFKWYRADNAAGTTGKTVITGATGKTYTVQTADRNKYLVFEVTPVAATGTPATLTGAAASAVSGQVEGSAPTAATVTMSGTFTVGSEVTASFTYADAESDAQGQTTYKWCWNVQGNATEVGCSDELTTNTFTLTSTQEGHQMRVHVTPKSSTGTPNTGLRATSGYSAVVQGSAPVASAVTMSGTFAVGSEITVGFNYYDAEGDAQSSGTIYKLCWNVPGNPFEHGCFSGTTNKFTLTSAQRGFQVRARVQAVSATGTPSAGNYAASDYSPVVQGAAPVASNAAVTGTLLVGHTVSASYTYNDADGDAQGASTINWCRVNVACGVGSGPQYTLQAADFRGSVNYRVTPKAATGTPNTGDTVDAIASAAVWEVRQTSAETGDVWPGHEGEISIPVSGILGLWDWTNNVRVQTSLGIAFNRPGHPGCPASSEHQVWLVAPSGRLYPITGEWQLIAVGGELINRTWKVRLRNNRSCNMPFFLRGFTLHIE